MVATAGCKGQPKPAVKAADDETVTLASMIQVADPRATMQLLRGFYAVEGSAWRWASRKFAVILRPPKGSDQKGATLQLKFAIPEPLIQNVNSVTLSASVNGVDLSPETWTRHGQFTYSRDVPSKALLGEAVTVEFAVDKAIPPSSGDTRELALIVSLVGFEAKP